MTTVDPVAVAHRYVQSLTPKDRVVLIRRLASRGMSEASISVATGLTVEQVRLWRAEDQGHAKT